MQSTSKPRTSKLSLMRMLAAATLSGLASLAAATSEKPMTFETFSPCSGNGDICSTRVLAKGRIELDTAKRLQAFLRAKAAQDQYFSTRPPIVFDSPGGSLVGGMELGRLIRRLKLDTELAMDYTEEVRDNSPDGYHIRMVAKNAICASACSLAFLGGVRRGIEEGARLGVHQFSTDSGALGEGGTQIAVTAVAAYVIEMGVDRGMVDLASVTATQDMHWITPGEARELRIDNTTAPLADWKVNVDKDGTPRVQAVQMVAPGHVVQLTLGEISGRYLIAVTTAFSNQHFKPDRLKQFPVDEQPEFTLTLNQRQKISPRPLGTWSHRPGQKDLTVFAATFEITRIDMTALRNARSLRMDDDFGHALSDVTLSSDLSVENLAGGIGLLLRGRR